MTRVIYKYPFAITDAQPFPLPTGAKILMVEMQGDQPCLWAEVEPAARLIGWTLCVVGTGQPFESGDREHIGSFQSGSFVWHVYKGR
jgi:hypothetical protein